MSATRRIVYDPDKSASLIAKVRERYAKFGAPGTADALDVADQLEAARAVVDVARNRWTAERDALRAEVERSVRDRDHYREQFVAIVDTLDKASQVIALLDAKVAGMLPVVEVAARVRSVVRDAVFASGVPIHHDELAAIIDRVAAELATATPVESFRVQVARAVDALPVDPEADAVVERALASRSGRYRKLVSPPLTAAPVLSAEERVILLRLREAESTALANIGHLDVSVPVQCGAAIALLDRLLGGGR